MKLPTLALAAALSTLALPSLALAQAVAVGTTVYGPQGNVAGTIVSVEGGIATLDTGTHKVPLPGNSFTKGAKGPTISVTKATLDQMMDQRAAAAVAARDAALVPGAAVVSAKGLPLGSIKTVEGDRVVLEASAGPVEMKREHFTVDAQNRLMARFTADQIAATAAGATGTAAE